MATNTDAEQRRLAKRYGITFLPPSTSSTWPLAHRKTFENIQKIGQQLYETFCAPIDIRTNEEPWRTGLKLRAVWLADNANRLLKQDRNEADWRCHIENDLFLRFRVEVACPKCRARIWQSEIDIAFDQFDRVSEELELRKKNRKQCQCPPGERSTDFYEIGTNPLFDDRLQKEMKYYPLPSHTIQKREPDRVFGLQQTSNFEVLLSHPWPKSATQGEQIKALRDELRVSPFKDDESPLIFPFLIVEAKSERSRQGFDDIQNQTAFPIWTLLNIQKNLRDQVKATRSELHPFVWFLANRGDAWRVYGCFITESESSNVKYDIIHLWDGSILSKDKALQLLMIVDYIFDWARDRYRPSILRQLKSLVTGNDYDTVSVANDTNIFSARSRAYSRVEHWEPGPPSEDSNVNSAISRTSLPTTNFQNSLSIDSTAANLVLHRSALVTRSLQVGLCITRRNVDKFLAYAGDKLNVDGSATAVTELLRIMSTHVSEMIPFTDDDIIQWEGNWSEDDTDDHDSDQSDFGSYEDFRVLFSFTVFINRSWEIIHEWTYLAVSTDVLDRLNKMADYPLTRREIDAMITLVRPYEADDICEAMSCLETYSPKQSLLAAISCMTISPFSKAEQEQRYNGESEKVGVFDAGTLKRSLLRNLVHKYHNIRPVRRARPDLDPTKLVKPTVHTGFTTVVEREKRGVDESFIRLFEIIAYHNPYRPAHYKSWCNMCQDERRETRKRNRETDLPWANPWNDEVEASDEGMVLVESLVLVDQRIKVQDSCMYTVKDYGVKQSETLASAVETLRRSGKVYHTYLQEE